MLPLDPVFMKCKVRGPYATEAVKSQLHLRTEISGELELATELKTRFTQYGLSNSKFSF